MSDARMGEEDSDEPQRGDRGDMPDSRYWLPAHRFGICIAAPSRCAGLCSGECEQADERETKVNINGRSEVELTVRITAETDADALSILRVEAPATVRHVFGRPESATIELEKHWCSGTMRVTVTRSRAEAAAAQQAADRAAAQAATPGSDAEVGVAAVISAIRRGGQ